MSTNLVEKAVALFDEGFNCAESTLLGLSSEFAPQCECIPKIATGFGGGMGRKGEVCGALTGAVMALGLKMGRESATDTETKERLYEKVAILFKAFEERFGELRCADLTGCDMSTDAGMDKYREENLHINLCHKLVAFAVEETERLARH